MATLKDHQQAMVELMATGSGIPASAMRLAHAMHDVLHIVSENLKEDILQQSRDLAAEWGAKHIRRAVEATTPGLNDKALARDLEACRPKATPAERRVKELENTVKQLRASNSKLRQEKAMLELTRLTEDMGMYDTPEQAGCRKDDAQVCEHNYTSVLLDNSVSCDSCGKIL